MHLSSPTHLFWAEFRRVPLRFLGDSSFEDCHGTIGNRAAPEHPPEDSCKIPSARICFRDCCIQGIRPASGLVLNQDVSQTSADVALRGRDGRFRPVGAMPLDASSLPYSEPGKCEASGKDVGCHDNSRGRKGEAELGRGFGDSPSPSTSRPQEDEPASLVRSKTGVYHPND